MFLTNINIFLTKIKKKEYLFDIPLSYVRKKMYDSFGLKQSLACELGKVKIRFVKKICITVMADMIKLIFCWYEFLLCF